MRARLSLLVALAAAGCFAAAPHTAEPDLGSDAVPSAPWIQFERCLEINVNTESPSLFDGFPPMIHPVRDARYLTPVLNTVDACQRATTANGTSPNPAFFTVAVPVEEVPSAKVPGAVGYLYLLNVSATSAPVRETFGRDYDVAFGGVDLAVSSVGTLPEGRGAAAVRFPGAVTQYDTVMAQPATNGKAGVLGVYSVDDKFLRAHTVTFSDYRGYATGTGVITYPDGQDPLLGVGPQRQSWPATHNVGFDVRFDFDTVVVPAYP